MKRIRVLQLIDSLRPGGAERMALNYFLALKNKGHHSFIAVSRVEGLLAESIREMPGYYFLKKTNVFDVTAFFRLKNILKINKIDIVQAHGSSYLWAVLCKITGSKIKILWHDHYGDSEFLKERKSNVIRKFSRYFDGIISVNRKLVTWAIEVLEFSKPLIYLPNFVNKEIDDINQLKGKSKFNIICVANLRPQKDHPTLIEAFESIQKKYDVSLHIVGRGEQNGYSLRIQNLIAKNSAIFYYGELNSVQSLLSRVDIGILSSKSEGLPLALLEYGIAGLAVITTRVGECESIIKNDGKIIRVGSSKDLADAMDFYLTTPEAANQDSLNLQMRVEQHYSEKFVLQQYLEFVLKI